MRMENNRQTPLKLYIDEQKYTKGNEFRLYLDTQFLFRCQDISMYD